MDEWLLIDVMLWIVVTLSVLVLAFGVFAGAMAVAGGTRANAPPPPPAKKRN